jgi:hypothetical protein
MLANSLGQGEPHKSSTGRDLITITLVLFVACAVAAVIYWAQRRHPADGRISRREGSPVSPAGLNSTPDGFRRPNQGMTANRTTSDAGLAHTQGMPEWRADPAPGGGGRRLPPPDDAEHRPDAHRPSGGVFGARTPGDAEEPETDDAIAAEASPGPLAVVEGSHSQLEESTGPGQVTSSRGALPLTDNSRLGSAPVITPTTVHQRINPHKIGLAPLAGADDASRTASVKRARPAVRPCPTCATIQSISSDSQPCIHCDTQLPPGLTHPWPGVLVPRD